MISNPTNTSIKSFDCRWKKRNKFMDTTGNHKINEEPIIDDTEVSPQYEDIYSDHEDNSMNLNIPRKRTFSVDYSEEIQDRITRANTRHHIRRNTLQEGVKDAEKIAQLEDEQNFLRDEIKELRSSLKDQMLMKQQINDLHSELIIRKTQSKSTLKNVEYESEEPTPVPIQASTDQYGLLESNLRSVKFTSHLRSDNRSKDISWEIPNFDLSKPLYESQNFDYANERFNLAFGKNNEDGYGFIVSLIRPRIKSPRVHCTFRLHDPSSEFPYTKTIEKQRVFETSKMSGGFARFASKEKVHDYIQNDGTLNISATLLFSDESYRKPVRHTIRKNSISFVSAIISFFKWVAIKICHRNTKKRKKKNKKYINELEEYNMNSPSSSNHYKDYPTDLTSSTAFSNATTSSMRTPEMRTNTNEHYFSPNRDTASRRSKRKRRPPSSCLS